MIDCIFMAMIYLAVGCLVGGLLSANDKDMGGTGFGWKARAVIALVWPVVIILMVG